MADIKLNFQWEISSDGAIEIQLTPVNSDVVLGRFPLDEDLFTQNLDDDISDYKLKLQSDVVFVDWQCLVDNLRDIANTIEQRVDTALYA